MSSKFNLRLVGGAAAFFAVFFGLMSMVGNVHVAEFYGCLGIASVVAVIVFFKIPKPDSAK